MPGRIGMPEPRAPKNREDNRSGQQNTDEDQDRGPHHGIRLDAPPDPGPCEARDRPTRP
jgi:hypothetical protein